jgi:hypothetical protein
VHSRGQCKLLIQLSQPVAASLLAKFVLVLRIEPEQNVDASPRIRACPGCPTGLFPCSRDPSHYPLAIRRPADAIGRHDC